MSLRELNLQKSVAVIKDFQEATPETDTFDQKKSEASMAMKHLTTIFDAEEDDNGPPPNCDQRPEL